MADITAKISPVRRHRTCPRAVNAPTTTATASTRSPQAAHATPRSTPAYTTVEVGLCDNSRRRFGSQRRRYVRQHYNPRAVETPWQQRCVMQFQR